MQLPEENFDYPPEVLMRRLPAAEHNLRRALSDTRLSFYRDYGEWLAGRAGPLGEEERGWVADPHERRTVLRRLLQAESKVADAIENDRRLARETFVILRRRVGRLGVDGISDFEIAAAAYRELVFAHARVKPLPLLVTPTRNVMLFLAEDGCAAEMIGWPAADPDDWEVRTNVFADLRGWQFDAGSGHIRLCRNPASWWAAGGPESAALCLLDATDLAATSLVESAETLTCDDGDHAAAVQKWLKRRRPKMPQLWISERSAA